MPQGIVWWTPAEIAIRNKEDDLWVSFLGKVYDLTALAQKYDGDVLLKPIVECAGTDISHWFNPETGEVRTHIDPVTGCVVAYTPKGRFLHIPPPVPRTDWSSDVGTPWWKDMEYCIGNLTSKTRALRVVNILSSQEQLIEVCTEESMNEIQKRYMTYNTHARSYTWKFNGRVLDMDKTLDANGVPDESEQFYNLAIDDTNEVCISEVQVYYNDDLTEG